MRRRTWPASPPIGPRFAHPRNRRDYRTLATFASAATGRKPILVGVSEGAGLSVLAATDPETKAVIGGVIGLGLPDLNELGWRWKDSLIYLTHRAPERAARSARPPMVAAVAPLPLAIIQSTHDEFVPLADTQRIFAQRVFTEAAVDR